MQKERQTTVQLLSAEHSSLDTTTYTQCSFPVLFKRDGKTKALEHHAVDLKKITF